jgi:hypothetical protein
MGGMVSESLSIWPSGRNNFSQLLNEHRVDVRQTETYAAEQLEPETSAFKLRRLLRS